MNQQELRQQWYDALKSDKYKQGRNYLRTMDDKYCCLGVACDLIDPDDWHTQMSRTGNSVYSYENLHSTAYMPMHIARLYGLTTEEQEILGGMNDYGSTFDEIAEEIKRRFL